MKRIAVFAVALWLSGASSRADLVLVQKVDGGGQSGTQTIKIKGQRSRADVAPSMSLVMDNATGESIVLRHTEKSFTRFTAEQGKALLGEMGKRRAKSEPPQLKPTGTKEKVGDYECEIFTTDLGGMAVKYWLARDFPDFPAIQQQLATVQSGSFALGSYGLMPDPKSFPGMTMKTEMELAGKKITVVTQSVKQESVADDLFAIPTGYREVTMPQPQFAP